MTNQAAYVDKALDEIAWEGMSICQTCFGVHGGWTFRNVAQPRPFYQRCRCEPDVPVGRQSHPENWDMPIAVQLCRCCTSTLLRGSSKWSVWFCEPCKQMVAALHQKVNAVVCPIGPHSLHSGYGIRGGNITVPQIQGFVTAMGDIFKRMERVKQWRDLSTRANIQAAGLAQDSEVSLPEFLDRLANREVDRSQMFASMAAFCGVEDSLI